MSSIILLGLYELIAAYTLNIVQLKSLHIISFILLAFALIRLLFLRSSGKPIKFNLIVFIVNFYLLIFLLPSTYLSGFLHPKINNEKIDIAAIHEAGHAIVAEKIAPGSVSEAKIIHGIQLRVMNQFDIQTLAYIRHDLKLTSIPPLEKIKDEICIKYGGLAATKIFFPAQEYSGASSDIEKINEFAKAVINNGISSAGPYNYDMLSNDEQPKVVKNLVAPEYERAKQIIENNKLVIKRLAQELIDNKNLTGDQVRSIIKEK